MRSFIDTKSLKGKAVVGPIDDWDQLSTAGIIGVWVSLKYI